MNKILDQNSAKRNGTLGAELFCSVAKNAKMQLMQGINYVTNEEGKRVAVMIDLKKHGELWEDFFDVLTAKMRENEPRESITSVKARLKKQGKLNV